MCMDIYLNKTFYLEAFKKLFVQIFSETSKGVELNFIFCVKFFGGNVIYWLKNLLKRYPFENVEYAIFFYSAYLNKILRLNIYGH